MNSVFVATMPAGYAMLLHFGAAEDSLKRWEVAVLNGVYVLSMAGVACWVLDLI